MSNIDEHLIFVGKGWHKIIKDLDSKLQKTDPDYCIDQIKEKFGGLRFYTSCLSAAGDEAVEEAEKLAAKTCEECGCEAERQNLNGWLKTVCNQCKNSL